MSTDSQDNSGILTEIEVYTGVCCVYYIFFSLSIYQKRPEERGKEGECEGERLDEEGGGQRDREEECDASMIGGEGELERGRG
jgi:hypothetical protein